MKSMTAIFNNWVQKHISWYKLWEDMLLSLYNLGVLDNYKDSFLISIRKLEKEISEKEMDSYLYGDEDVDMGGMWEA